MLYLLLHTLSGLELSDSKIQNYIKRVCFKICVRHYNFLFLLQPILFLLIFIVSALYNNMVIIIWCVLSLRYYLIFYNFKI